MNFRIARYAALCALQVAAFAALAAPARAADLASPMVLVATPALGASGYRETVLLAVPVGDGSHFGFILNRPTDTPLAELFPDDDASRRVSARVHFGGPLMTDGLFALVRGRGEPERQLVGVTPQLSVALQGDAVDRVIAEHPGDARFFVGLVGWRPGELAAELRAGAWDVVDPEADLVLSTDSAGLWKRLAPRARGIRVHLWR
jgi:putative transcriptional regulator